MNLARATYASASAVVLAGILSVPAADWYYKSSWGEGCARCHEIRPNFQSWQHSSHRKVNCIDCHSSTLQTSFRRVASHLKGDLPERVTLRTPDAIAMVDRCARCHQQEFAQWRAGPHATTYARIFTDPEHNRKRRLMDDCLRCHGMHFEGSIGDVVTPVSLQGPWQLKDRSFINQPAIPCLACHAVHRPGEPMTRAASRTGPKQEIARPSLALFDRRSRMPIALDALTVPPMLDRARPVKMSPDRRQSLCYQCHAPLASREVGSGDDRTAIGVHEGISCLACHQKHGQWTRASCADCHPRLSNCGLDVEKMDTTFLDPKSKHDVHWVKCADCHPKGVPPKRNTSGD